MAGRRSMDDREARKHNQLAQKIGKILDETRTSSATHNRKLKDLSSLLSQSQPHFFSAFTKTLAPLFDFQRRAPASERVVHFLAAFCRSCASGAPSHGTSFLINFLHFLLAAAAAASKTARFRACQIISEIILRLPDDADVGNEQWDEVIETLMHRVKDKVPVIRIYAIRALSRFVNGSENSDILDLFLEALSLEQNVEVRKTLLLSLPPSSATSRVIIDCTLDESESVRKATYCVLANKFPLQSLSIKLRTLILQRGLADRSDAVVKECLKLLKDEWLVNCCKGDTVELLKYLDVETYELVGESVMLALLKAGVVRLHDVDGIQKYTFSSSDNAGVGEFAQHNIQLVGAEVALYWRVICRHLLMEAQEKGSDAANAVGTEAALYAAEASDSNDLLERILPVTISDYIDLVRAHINAGPNYRFASRQLLLLGAMLDFSDATNRKMASAFVRELLLKPLEHEIDDEGNKVALGDCINLGGDREWADAVSALARKVHSASGEFEEAVLEVVEELAQPCRERTADSIQWMHCLSVTGLLLESAKSFGSVRSKAIKLDDLLQFLLLPGAKHVHLDVQRVAIRCLGLLGLLDRKLSKELIDQLRQSFVDGPPPTSRMASTALIDLLLWHGPWEIERASGKNPDMQLQDNQTSVNFSDVDETSSVELLHLLYAGFDRDDWIISVPSDESESIHAVLGEGFAKILLLSNKYPSISASTHQLVMVKLICLYFSDHTKELQRLRQCLSVFFEHYPSLSPKHKEVVSKAFIPAVKSIWPGINGNAGGSAHTVSIKRKRAVQASRFMLQMMQAPLYAKETKAGNGYNTRDSAETYDNSDESSVEWGEEGLGIRIATEVVGFPAKKTPAERSYISALSRILVLIKFRPTEQHAVKLMRRLLFYVNEAVSSEKDLSKELNRLAEHLKALDEHHDQEFSQEEANQILRRLEISFELDAGGPMAVPQTPVPGSARPTRKRRQARREEWSSDEELAASPTSVATGVPATASARSQRASKTAALTRMAKRETNIDEEDESEVSDVTSEEESDGSE
ncbi:condensin complex subunit 3 isoform X2 [Punica granatum]|uniref:Condensin complex subunit 3 isoform X2 n=1 Tax=Punica granatum TaxID=22663 RepID=A0A6P8DWV0_PUNGR|nr:condensin complex subunit 3 isoform X2 [Punica granatum]